MQYLVAPLSSELRFDDRRSSNACRERRCYRRGGCDPIGNARMIGHIATIVARWSDVMPSSFSFLLLDRRYARAMAAALTGCDSTAEAA
jgi:hypothetical protein